jgi:hypothetical protein
MPELELVDVVINPSTPLAYAKINPEDIEPFKEEKKVGSENMLKEDKYSKFDAWLLA